MLAIISLYCKVKENLQALLPLDHKVFVILHSDSIDINFCQHLAMRLIKRLYVFILKSFLPLFAMTFFIVLFIVLMQFLWKHIDDLVGKGLPFSLIGELFFYAAVSMVPMALPLAILLASLMTYGNFGEKFELTAMKASGISLIHTMRPLIFLVILISVGAFFFQNNVLPQAQVKMWTLLFSMRQKSPEVEIPEGVFYDQIPGYNLLVQKKNMDTGMLYDVMIYDVTRGGDNTTILVADSAMMAFTGDMKYLYLHMYYGEQFENLREQKSLDKNVPFRRETFHDKQVLLPFDANFNRMDEQGIRSQYVGKNITELQHTIDSIGERIDSTGQIYAKELRKNAFPLLVDNRTGQPVFSDKVEERTPPPPTGRNKGKQIDKKIKEDKEKSEAEDSVKTYPPINLDSLIRSVPGSKRDDLFDRALQISRRHVNDYQFKSAMVTDDKFIMRRHEIELLKKYTLSVACIIFFFIGAPLGAIIRKGGLGTPLVISVLLFLFYYIIDNAGYKMARDGRWEVWIGIWLSTFILAPLGIYVTYQAMNDSAVFNADSYKNLLRKLLSIRDPRSVGRKEVIINEISVPEALRRLTQMKTRCRKLAWTLDNKPSFFQFWAGQNINSRLLHTGDSLDALIQYLTDCHNNDVVDKLSDFPWIYTDWILDPSQPEIVAKVLKWIFPVSYPLYLVSLHKRKKMAKSLETVAALCSELYSILNPSSNKN